MTSADKRLEELKKALESTFPNPLNKLILSKQLEIIDDFYMALIKEECRLARVEEVERISRYVELRHTADGAIISAHYLHRQACKRLKELSEEVEKDNGKS